MAYETMYLQSPGYRMGEEAAQDSTGRILYPLWAVGRGRERSVGSQTGEEHSGGQEKKVQKESQGGETS